MNLEEWYLELGAKEAVYFPKDVYKRCTIYFNDAEWIKTIRSVTVDSKGNIYNAQGVTLEEIYKAIDFVKTYCTW